MKLVCSYANCQLQAMIYFLKKSKMADHYEFRHFNNYQILLGEQTPEDLMAAASKADIFVYQETPVLKYGMLSTEDMCVSTVPKDCLKISTGYGYNDGLFPICHHGSWRTGRQILKLAKEDTFTLFAGYDYNSLNFDCALRFIKCAREQMRRETNDTIKMADYVLSHFQKERLFLCENHPCSAYLSELARRFLFHVEPSWEDRIPYATDNDANLPCGMLTHQAVVNELELEYPADKEAHGYFRGFLDRLVKDLAAT